MKQIQSLARSRGFSSVAAVTALLVVVVVGGAGWLVLRKHHTTSTATHPTQTATTKKPATTQPADPSEGGKYLVIKEWGVRVPLPAELQGDIEYGISKNVNLSFTGDPVYGDVAYLASKKIAAIDPQSNTCVFERDPDNPNSYDGARMSINRSTTKLEPSGSDIFVEGYWYQVVNGNGGVCYPGSNGTLEGDFAAAIVTAVKSLQTIPQQ